MESSYGQPVYIESKLLTISKWQTLLMLNRKKLEKWSFIWSNLRNGHSTAKNNCIGDCSVLSKIHFPSLSNKFDQFLHVSTAVEQLLKTVRCNDVNISENTEISPGLGCRDSERWFHLPSFHEIVVSCEPWPWSTDSFTVAVDICSVHNNNTTVGHLL